MKLSDLLEITNNYKNIKDLQPLNESYAAEPLRRWHKQMLQRHLLHDQYISKILKYNPKDKITNFDITSSLFKENMRYMFTSIVSKYPTSLSMQDFLNKIMEENFHPKLIYDVMYDQYNKLDNTQAAKQFIENTVICTTNIFNIWDHIKLGGKDTMADFMSFKLANIKPDEFTEIPLSDIRLRKYSNDFIFFEDENGELMAISEGVKLICVFKKTIGQIPVINVNSDKFNWQEILSISDEKFIKGYLYFLDKCYFSMATEFVYYIYNKIFNNYKGLTECYDIVWYSKDNTLYTKDDIIKELGKISTKVLIENEYPLYKFGKLAKAYVIPRESIDKNTSISRYNDRWSYNYHYTNKYDTNDERIQDLAYMKERFEKLKDNLKQSKEFLGLTNKISEQYDILDKKLHMLYKIYYDALRNDMKSKTSEFNKEFMGEVDTKSHGSIVSFLAGISRDIMELQYKLINILNDLKDFSAMDIVKMSMQKPEDFNKLQSNIRSTISSYNHFFKVENERRSNLTYVQRMIENYSDVYPDLAEIFDFSNVTLKN